MLPIQYFPTPAKLRRWFEENHDTAAELHVGYYKIGSGRPSITWPESVDEALCFGWIDGVRRSVDAEAYTIRFTPRKKGSIWSAVNIKRFGELVELGRVRPEGLAAFERRKEHKSKIYSYEQGEIGFNETELAQFQANEAAWAGFQKMPPSYRKTATWLVVSAKQEATRHKRLAELIADSAEGRKIKQLRRPGDKA